MLGGTCGRCVADQWVFFGLHNLRCAAMMRRCAFRWLCATVFAALLTTSQVAQAQDVATRAEEIELARRQKHATLWPEREGPLVARANRLLDRGLIEGIRSGQGNNGWQLALHRHALGAGPDVRHRLPPFGPVPRRAERARDRARHASRGAARGRRGGDQSGCGDRPTRSSTSIRSTSGRRRWSSTASAAIREGRPDPLPAGNRLERSCEPATASRGTSTPASKSYGGYAHTGPTSGDDVPSIETIFDATTAPGLFDDTTFIAWGAFAGFDTRDLPARAEARRLLRRQLHAVHRPVGAGHVHPSPSWISKASSFFPYFNETRVLAFFVERRFAYAGDDDRVVPFYICCRSSAATSSSAASTSTGSTTTTRSWPRSSIGGTPSPASRWRSSWTPARPSRRRARWTSPDLNYSGGIGFRVRLAGRGRAALRHRQEPRRRPRGSGASATSRGGGSDVGRALGDGDDAARARAARLAIGYPPRSGRGAEVLSGRSAGARTDAAAGSRSGHAQPQPAPRSRVRHVRNPRRAPSRARVTSAPRASIRSARCSTVRGTSTVTVARG